MSSGDSSHLVRINYFSDPDVTYSLTGTATGVAGTNDNQVMIISAISINSTSFIIIIVIITMFIKSIITMISIVTTRPPL